MEASSAAPALRLDRRPSRPFAIDHRWDRNFLFTRRRLYSAYVFGAAWGLGIEFFAIWLYVSPWWKPFATVLIGR